MKVFFLQLRWKLVVYSLFAFSSLPFFCSCYSNLYEDYYTSTHETDYVKTTGRPELVEFVDPSLLKKLQEEQGYVVIGTSSFYHFWTPRVFALDCAEQHGASLVLVLHQKGDEKQKSKTVYMPVSNTTYSSGVMYGPYGPHGVTWGSTTYGSVPVTVNYTETYYPQFAYFLAKRKHINSFGVYFQRPENIPGASSAAVRISIVVPGSKADRQGIRAGDLVRKINGSPVLSQLDVEPYKNGSREIESMEVSHE